MTETKNKAQMDYQRRYRGFKKATMLYAGFFLAMKATMPEKGINSLLSLMGDLDKNDLGFALNSIEEDILEYQTIFGVNK